MQIGETIDRPAPAVAVSSLVGAYRGWVRDTDLAAAAAELGLSLPARLAREKRWSWFGAGDEEVAAGGAVVDLGLLGSVFLWVVDRRTGALLVDGSSLLLPGRAKVSDTPAGGVIARASRLRGGTFELGRDGSLTTVRARLFGADVELALEDRGAPMAAICPIPAGLNVTHKQAGLDAHGVVRAAGRTFELRGGSGFTDHTHGLLARDTSWRWAAAFGRLPDGRAIGLNVTEGFNDGVENVAFLGGAIVKVGAPRFERDPSRPEARWRVVTDDGAVDLRLAPEAVRREDVDLKLAVSRYAQPVGAWSGTLLGVRVERLLGVAEDHVARW